MKKEPAPNESRELYRRHEMAKWKQSPPRARSIRNLINHNINPVLPRSDNSLPDPRIMGKLFN